MTITEELWSEVKRMFYELHKDMTEKQRHAEWVEYQLAIIGRSWEGLNCLKS